MGSSIKDVRNKDGEGLAIVTLLFSLACNRPKYTDTAGGLWIKEELKIDEILCMLFIIYILYNKYKKEIAKA